MPIPAGFNWSTPFIADACVQLSLPVRVGPPGLRCTIPGSRIAGPVCLARHAGSTDVFLDAIASANPGEASSSITAAASTKAALATSSWAKPT